VTHFVKHFKPQYLRTSVIQSEQLISYTRMMLQYEISRVIQISSIFSVCLVFLISVAEYKMAFCHILDRFVAPLLDHSFRWSNIG
jgi:hypothetical protein